MSNEATQNQNARANGSANRPTHVVKTRTGRGKNATYERLGVAWENEDASIYVKLHGTQVIDSGFTLYIIEDAEKAGA